MTNRPVCFLINEWPTDVSALWYMNDQQTSLLYDQWMTNRLFCSLINEWPTDLMSVSVSQQHTFFYNLNVSSIYVCFNLLPLINIYLLVLHCLICNCLFGSLAIDPYILLIPGIYTLSTFKKREKFTLFWHQENGILYLVLAYSQVGKSMVFILTEHLKTLELATSVRSGI